MADEIVVNVARVAEIVVRTPVLIGYRWHFHRVDYVTYEVTECYAAALTYTAVAASAHPQNLKYFKSHLFGLSYPL